MKEEHPPDPKRIGALCAELEEELAKLRIQGVSPGPTLDTLSSKLKELISIAKALEARGQKVSPTTRAVLWHLGVRITAEIIHRIVSAAHNYRPTLFRGPHGSRSSASDRRVDAWPSDQRDAASWRDKTKGSRGCVGCQSHLPIAS